MECYLTLLRVRIGERETKHGNPKFICGCFTLKSEEEIIAKRVWYDSVTGSEVTCPLHEELSFTENAQIAADELESSPPVIALPKSVHLQRANITGNEFGVWSNMRIPKGIRFGPYEGVTVHDEDEADQNGYSWKVLKEKDIWYFMDATKDEHESSWLHYVNFAYDQEQQNLVVLQYNGQVYYETIKDISPDTELLLWCEDDDATVSGNETEDNAYLCEMKSTQKMIKLQDNNKQVHTHRRPYTSVSYKWKYHLEKKNSIHAREKHYTCNICEKKFMYNSALKLHARIHTGEKPHTCDVCEKKFTQLSQLKSHKRIHTGEKPYTCDICEKKFTQIGQLKSHKRIHSRGKPYTCDVCEKKFTRITHFKLHKRIHMGEKPYTCDICEKKFIWKDGLEHHKVMHTGEKPYACDMCEKKFARKSDLKRHKRLHTGEKPYTCDVCKKKFTQSGDLRQHNRLHTGEKPYTCDVCEEKFACKGYLKRHQRLHTGEKPYTCDICEKKFAWWNSFVHHKLLHTAEKPYACDTCEKKFTRKGDLKRHKRLHTEKSLVCEKFTQKSDLK